MYAPDFWLEQGGSRMSTGTSEPYSVQPPTEELYQPHEISSGVVAPEARLVIDFSMPVASSKVREYVSLLTTVSPPAASRGSSLLEGGAAAEAEAVNVARPTGGSAISKTSTWSALLARRALAAAISLALRPYELR